MTLIIANTFWKRFRGLAGSPDRDRILLLLGCRSVHTFGMKYHLDLFWLDERDEVIRVDKQVRPGRIKTCKAACGVVEFSSEKEAISSQNNKSILSSFLQNQSGQALVETALVLPVLLLLLFGFLQFGILIFQKQEMLYVNNYSVQVGSLTNDDEQVMGAIRESYEDGSGVLVDIQTGQYETGNSLSSAQRRYRDTLTVVLSWEHPLLVPLFAWDHVTLQTAASARVLCRNEGAPFTCE